MKAVVTLKKNHEFQRLYRRGASAVGGGMVIYCRRNRLRRNRIGLTASVKLGNAVQRNRARRRLREVYRLNAAKLSPGWDLILVARSRTLTASWPELNATFVRLCRKLGMLQETPDAPRNVPAALNAPQNAAALPDAPRNVPAALNASRNAAALPDAPRNVPVTPDASRNAPPEKENLP